MKLGDDMSRNPLPIKNLLLYVLTRLEMFTFPVFILYIVFWPSFGIIWQNPFLARFGFWHTIIVISILLFTILVRIRLPNTWASVIETITIPLFVLVTGELFFHIFFDIYFMTVPYTWILEMLILFAATLLFNSHRAFNRKGLVIIVVSEVVFMMFWISQGFHISFCNNDCLFGVKYFLDIPTNILENVQWIIWISGMTLSLKSRSELNKIYGKKT